MICFWWQAGSQRFQVWALVCASPRILWETSEVTRVWAAIRTKAVGQSLVMLLTHRIRQQAGSHRFCDLDTGLCINRFEVWAPVCASTQVLWETSEVTRVWAAIRTKAVGQSLVMLLIHRIRQQAGSPRHLARIKSRSAGCGAGVDSLASRNNPLAHLVPRHVEQHRIRQE
ncbi:hypothetical protein SAMN03159444_03143 [Pseudomonas sp. NFACC02]|nr:hypothetical protein SAMN03159444_03143 [Pseudomonas sp. NFACC02]